MPPGAPKSPRGCVKKSRLSDEPPLEMTEPITIPSMATAAAALSTAMPAKIFSTILRRRRPADLTERS